MYNMTDWIEEQDCNSLLGYDYWNDEAEELQKEWNVIDNGLKTQEQYLKESGLSDELLNIVRDFKGLKKQEDLVGLELAAGNCWSAPILFSELNIEKMTFLDFSKHRIFKYAPVVLEHYLIPTDKVNLVRGSFYDLKIDGNSVDFVLLSQAFHHAEDPIRLLTEIRRVLKKGGIVLIIGEPLFGKRAKIAFYKHFVKCCLLKDYRCELTEYRKTRIIAKDEILGDLLYSDKGYKFFFKKSNLKYKMIKLNNVHRCFVLEK